MHIKLKFPGDRFGLSDLESANPEQSVDDVRLQLAEAIKTGAVEVIKTFHDGEEPKPLLYRRTAK